MGKRPTRAPTFRKVDLDRTIRALKDAGETIGRVEVEAGRVTILTGSEAVTLTPLEQFKAERAKRAQRAS